MRPRRFFSYSGCGGDAGTELRVFGCAIRWTAQQSSRLVCNANKTPTTCAAAQQKGRNSHAGYAVEIGPINAQIAQAVERLKSMSPAGKAGDTNAAGGTDFVSSLNSALGAVSKTQNDATELQRQFQLENSGVSLEETMIAMNKAQLSFSAAVQVRNRLVQAYDQIMQMPV
jgi:flagellar hook-basal body complex protein FliE